MKSIDSKEVTTQIPEKEKIHLGVLISGRGSNLAAIVQAIHDNVITDADVAVVISSFASAPGLEIALADNIPGVVVCASQKSREEYDRDILEQLKESFVDWVILAGYNRIISPCLLAAYQDKILNIHPSLLPAYGGKGMVGEKVHRAVLNAGETETGCTVHLVTEEVDVGPILGQARVPVLKDDTVETLAARVLEQEHRLYPQIIQQVIQVGSVSAFLASQNQSMAPSV